MLKDSCIAFNMGNKILIAEIISVSINDLLSITFILGHRFD